MRPLILFLFAVGCEGALTVDTVAPPECQPVECSVATSCRMCCPLSVALPDLCLIECNDGWRQTYLEGDEAWAVALLGLHCP